MFFELFFKKIEIEPIIDVYQFIDSKESNFCLIKLLIVNFDSYKGMKNAEVDNFHTISSFDL